MNLSPKQEEAFNLIMAWLNDKNRKRFVLGGYAGTGKSTLARHLEEAIGAHNIYYCAYTGKAANVLREKGCKNVNTIHGYTYILEKTDHNHKPVFVRNHNSVLKTAKLVILDEYSMLPEHIIKDLEMSCAKILYLGDPFQLPPVNGECPLKPDFFLTEIHRQALDSPIIRYATMVREGRYFGYVQEDGFIHAKRQSISQEKFLDVEQIICGTNATRRKVNDWYRERTLFEKTELPQKGEKLICLKNNAQLGIFNGMIATCGHTIEWDDEFFTLSFDYLEPMNFWIGDVTGHGQYIYNRNFPLERIDYAYAITAHKSQGSEFKSIIVKNEPVGATQELRKRWLYTAITRARESCTLVS